MEGWIKIHRKMLDWEWFSCSKTVHLFMYLLLKASRNDYKWKGKEFKCGQLPFGLNKASLETGLSIQNIRTSLEKLVLTNEITKEATTQGSVITLINWSKYQVRNSELTNDLTNDLTSELTNGQQTANTRPTTTKKNKNYKKNKEVKNNIDFDFELAYSHYPLKKGKTAGMRKLKSQIKTEADFKLFCEAIQNYSLDIQDNGTAKAYIKHFGTFVGSWRDFTPENGWKRSQGSLIGSNGLSRGMQSSDLQERQNSQVEHILCLRDKLNELNEMEES